eukprot:3493-Heterococcus_DN1.PRE.2
MHSELLLDRCSAHVSAPLRHQTPEVGEHAVKTIAVICTHVANSCAYRMRRTVAVANSSSSQLRLVLQYCTSVLCIEQHECTSSSKQ